MKQELTSRAVHAGQGRNGHQFPTLEIEHIAGEDVGEKVFFQISIDCAPGCKSTVLSA